MADLIELDSLEIQAIIDNELDPISASPNPAVLQTGSLRDVAAKEIRPRDDGSGEISLQVRMRNICCSAHGLSLLITGVKDGVRRTMLFDTGPEESAWERNASRLQADIGRVELVTLSHWHCDHSGGMLTIDLHPNRPERRGFQIPEAPLGMLEPDPEFAEIELAGGLVVKSDKAHTVLDGYFLVSGEIPRTTAYEKGVRFGMRLEQQKWVSDELLRDERLLMCKLKGKGIVVFTGCAHAGVVNSARHAIELGGGAPLYAVHGGFHLADADVETIEHTVSDLQALKPTVLLPGHCTGWRAKYAIENRMPGQMVPSFVGSSYAL